MSAIHSLYQRGPIVARQVNQVSSARAQFGAGLSPRRQRSSGQPEAPRVFYSCCAA